jgi:membrane fusion protein, multidrug efflux system
MHFYTRLNLRSLVSSYTIKTKTNLVLTVAFSILVMSCSKQKEQEKEEIKFVVTSPLRQDTTLIREYVGQIHATQHIELRALERGYLQKTYVDEGALVHTGQLMFQITPIIYQADLNKAEAESRFAEIEYLTTKRLADSHIVASNELAKTKAKYEKANAEVSLAKAHLSFTHIKAPFNGIMDHYYVRQGSLLDEGELISTLSDNSKMWVYFNVPEAEYLDYKTHAKKDSVMHVSLVMANNQMFSHPGIVETIEADFNNQTGNIAFRATFPNPEGLLRHGETGNIRMVIPAKKALLIPQKATFEILDKKFVYVIDKNNVVHLREITIAADLPDLYIIKDGLSSSDKILLEGLQKVRDLDKITFTYQDPKEVLKTLKVYTE